MKHFCDECYGKHMHFGKCQSKMKIPKLDILPSLAMPISQWLIFLS